jgi:hypothetical protein
MNTAVNSILAQDTTKTAKIQQLIILGLTRKDIARLITNGNYGFVQNVYAKMRAQGLLDQITQSLTSVNFNTKFGVEFEAYNVSKAKLNSALNRAGINCEIEGYNHTTRNYWKIVTDSSLSGSQSFELVSPILQGEQGLAEVETVCRVLNECNAKVNKSCGTHVHLNASNFNLQTWKNIYINYARLEKTIDNFMPLSRRNNRFCKSLKNITNFERKINEATSLQALASNVFHSDRYFKVNPISYARHNTCEFRQHAGTVEYIKISSWIRFLHNLVEFSKQGLVSNTTLEGLKAFNNDEIVNYFKIRTNKFQTQC